MPIVDGKEYAYTEKGIAAAEKAKGSGLFKLRSGNTPLFKTMGSSPVKKQTGDILPLDAMGNTKSLPNVDPFSDHEKAIENATNNYNPGGIKGEGWTPSEEQIAIELKKIKEEK